MSVKAAPRAGEEALERLGRSFKAATGAVRRLRGRETQHPGELSYAQYSLLFGLAEQGELSARELAIAADLSPATVTPMLDALDASGLVTRVRSTEDRRVVLSALTERGRRLVAERRARFEARWREALSSFDDAQLADSAAVLDRLAALFDELK